MQEDLNAHFRSTSLIFLFQASSTRCRHTTQRECSHHHHHHNGILLLFHLACRPRNTSSQSTPRPPHSQAGCCWKRSCG
jgi:hypothetical protein